MFFYEGRCSSVKFMLILGEVVYKSLKINVIYNVIYHPYISLMVYVVHITSSHCLEILTKELR
jgi:hypothetical protein